MSSSSCLMVYFPACTTLTNTSCHPLSLNYKLCSSLYAIRFSGFHLQLTWPWVNPLCNKIHISNMQYTFPSFEMAVLGCFWCVTRSKETLCSSLQTMEILCLVAGDWMLLQNYDWYAYFLTQNVYFLVSTNFTYKCKRSKLTCRIYLIPLLMKMVATCKQGRFN